MNADDGVRLWIGDSLLVDQWDGPAGQYSADVELVAGTHVLTLEYNDIAGAAAVRLNWAPLVPPSPTPTATPTSVPRLDLLVPMLLR